jgi:hypothetical protein
MDEERQYCILLRETKEEYVLVFLIPVKDGREVNIACGEGGAFHYHGKCSAKNYIRISNNTCSQ